MRALLTDVGPWESAPIDPTWIIEGSPTTRVRPIAQGGDLSSGFWECTAGHFDWHYGADESVYILEGHVLLRDRAEGIWYDLRPGDSVTFRAGSTVEWVVGLYVRKFWVIGPRPSLLRRLIRLARGAK
jgi:uncharacterized cupin superfamily protein